MTQPHLKDTELYTTTLVTNCKPQHVPHDKWLIILLELKGLLGAVSSCKQKVQAIENIVYIVMRCLVVIAHASAILVA